MHEMAGDRTLPEQSEVRATVLMEFIIDKLKLLNYERDFCSLRKPPWARLHKLYFALPSSNRNEQFLYFTNIVAWLLNLIGRNFATPNESDDPNATCANILVELQELGFAPPSWPPAKLKQGHGDAVCSVLDGLTSLTLEVTKFDFQAPIHQTDGYPEESPHVMDDLAGTNDELYVPELGDEEELNPDIGSRDLENRRNKDQSVLVSSKVDPQKWKLEVERIASQLRVAVVADGKDWRAHLEQAQRLHSDMSRILTSSGTQLHRVEENVAAALEKLESREKFINLQFEPLAAEYATVKERLAEIQENHRKSSGNVTFLTNELSQHSDKVEQVKQLMVEKGNVISDVSPLVQIKAAIQNLKIELQEMDVQIGVLQHSFIKFGTEWALQASKIARRSLTVYTWAGGNRWASSKQEREKMSHSLALITLSCHIPRYFEMSTSRPIN